MKSAVMYSSKPRKMLSFSTTKVDNVNVLCIDPATEKLTFYATKSSKSKENSQTSNQSWFLSLTLHPQGEFSTTDIKGELGVSPHVRESGFRNPGIFCSWNPESWALESGIQHQESGILLKIGIRNPTY